MPGWHYLDSLKTEYSFIGSKQQVDCILANSTFTAATGKNDVRAVVSSGKIGGRHEN